MAKPRSRLRFALESLEGMVVVVGAFCTWPLSKRWLKNWGARPDELERGWPGDRLVSPDHRTCTRVIGIQVPAVRVWPWVVQFGLGRAGFYSYELLERLAGIPVTNVESIISEMQSLEVGDEIHLHPKAPGIPVGEIQPGRYVCFGERPDQGAAEARPDPARSWSIYIEPTGPESCRLLLRGCVEELRESSWLKRRVVALDEPIDFVMEQRMLRSIKRLAETESARLGE